VSAKHVQSIQTKSLIAQQTQTNRDKSKNVVPQGMVSLAEIGSMQMEFFHLAYQTGDSKFADKPMKVFKMLRDIRPQSGLFSTSINQLTGSFAGNILFIPFSLFSEWIHSPTIHPL